MVGYNGYSMSNNAVAAYDRGLMPLSKWTKSAILDAISNAGFNPSEFSNWTLPELKTLLISYEWHHTGGAFQKTKFYELNADALDEYLGGRPKPTIKSERKSVLSEEDGFWHGKCKYTEYHPASRHNKYNIWYEPFENAKRKGDWIILSDGSKKKFSNCIDLVHTKTKRKQK